MSGPWWITRTRANSWSPGLSYHIETKRVSAGPLAHGAGAAVVWTFTDAYGVAPVVVANLEHTRNGFMYATVRTPSTTAVTIQVDNNSGATETPYVHAIAEGQNP